MSAERMRAYGDDSNSKAEFDPALEAAVEDIFDTMPDKVDFPADQTETSEETSETLTTEDKGNIYDRIGRIAGRLSEGAEGRQETRAAMKMKLIGFGKRALRISAATGAAIVGAPVVAAAGAGYLAYQGGKKGAELAKDAAQTVGSELKYAASELGADARIAFNDAKESYQDTKESAKNFFKEKAQNAKDRKNARLAKISGGFNRIKDNAGERVATLNRRRRALGARAVSVVDRARAVKDAAQDTWKQTGEQNQL